VKSGHRQVLHGLVQGHPQGIAVGDLADQLLQRQGSAQPLQISNQAERTIRLPLPAEGLITVRQYPQLHRNRFPGKAGDHTAENGLKAKIFEAGGQLGRVANDRWQDRRGAT